MSDPKRKGSAELPDLSHHPTRKVDSMSALVAEMLLRDPDADVTSPGLPAVDAGAVDLDAVDESAASDAAGLDMARLIEVRSNAAPSARRAFPTSSAYDSDAIPAFRPRRARVIVAIAVLCVVAVVAAALALSQGCGA